MHGKGGVEREGGDHKMYFERTLEASGVRGDKIMGARRGPGQGIPHKTVGKVLSV